MGRWMVVAVLTGVALSAGPVAQASTVELGAAVTQRLGAEATYEYGYVGPPVGESAATVGPLGTSVDDYVCPGTSVNTRALVIPDEPNSIFTATSTYLPDVDSHTHSFQAKVINWSLDRVFYRVAASCTTQPHLFPPARTSCRDLEGFDVPCAVYGNWFEAWAQELRTYGFDRGPTAEEYAEVVQDAFCWKSPWPGCPSRTSRVASSGTPGSAAVVAAQRGGNRFTLRNGTNRIALSFFTKGSQRPPAVLLKGASGCRARGLGLAVSNGAGQLTLALACSGLKQGGGAVRLTVRRAIAKAFHLRRGDGTLRIRLDKPPGSVKPWVFVTDGRAGSQCRSVGHRLRLTARTLDLRIAARCGRVARNATGHVYVGGLLAADR